MSRSVALGWAIALGVGCQGDDWIIGGELPPDMPADGSASGAVERLGGPEACPSAADISEQRREAYGAASVAQPHVGRWRGAVQDVAGSGFPGSEIELLIEASGAGTLLFDTAPTDEGEDDPARGYLCSAAAAGVICGSASGFVGGFAYPVEGVQSREGVLSFAVVTADPWGTWCALHAPLRWEDAPEECAFGVLPPARLEWGPAGCARIGGDGAEAIDCALMYALEFCGCAHDACFSTFARSVEVGLELSPDGLSLHGSLWYEDGRSAAQITLNRT